MSKASIIAESPSELELTDYSELGTFVRAVPVQNSHRSFRSQITKTDLTRVTQKKILSTFTNPILEKAFLVHNLRTFARRSKYIYVILCLLEVYFAILNFVLGKGWIDTARAFTSGFALVSKNDTEYCHHLEDECEVWLELWGTEEVYYIFMADHLIFLSGCLVICICLFYVTRTSQDGKFFLRDSSVLIIARYGVMASYVFWFVVCICRLGVFFGWPWYFAACEVDVMAPNSSKYVYSIVPWEQPLRHQVTWPCIYSGWGKLGFGGNEEIAANPAFIFRGSCEFLFLIMLSAMLGHVPFRFYILHLIVVFVCTVVMITNSFGGGSAGVLYNIVAASGVCLLIIMWKWTQGNYSRRDFINSVRVEKEGLDSGMNHVVEELTLLKQNLTAQANVGHEKRKYPPYWTLKPDGDAVSGRFLSNCKIYQAAIQKMVDESVLVDMLGTGRDTRVREKANSYNRLRVKKVYRLQNTTLWDLYCTQRDRIVSQRNKAFKLDKTEPVNNIVPITLKAMQKGGAWSAMPLESSANEVLLFHGTRTEVVNLIEEHGIDERYGQLDGLFGAGNYFAENASKADQYCTADKESKLFPMFLVRVCLGSSVGSTGRDGEAEPVVPTLGGRMWQKMGVGNPRKYFRSAQSVANKMSPADAKRKYLHSVIGHGIGAKDGLEFVAYQGIQCYPEILFYYERVYESNDGESGETGDDSENANLQKLLNNMESKSTESTQAKEELKMLHDQTARAQIKLLQLDNLNNWYVFQIKEQERRKLELQGLSDKPPQLNRFTLNFMVRHLEQSFRISHFRNLGKTFLWRYLLFSFQEAVYWCMNILTMSKETGGFSRSLVEVSSSDTKYGPTNITGRPHTNNLFIRTSGDLEAGYTVNFIWGHLWASFGALAIFFFLLIGRRSRDEKYLRKLSEYWNVIGCFYWFTVHISRLTAFYGWPWMYHGCEVDWSRPNNSDHHYSVLGFPAKNHDLSWQCLYSGFGWSRGSVDILQSTPNAFSAGMELTMLLFFQVIFCGMRFIYNASLLVVVFTVEVAVVAYAFDDFKAMVVIEYAFLLVVSVIFLYFEESTRRREFVNTNKLLKRKIDASLKFQSNFETSRELLRKIFSRDNANREAPMQPPAYWNEKHGRIDASNTIPMLQHMVDTTTLTHMLGTGRDTRVRSEQYSRLRIKKAYRLQNATQWNLYRTRREAIASQHKKSLATTGSPNKIGSLVCKSMLEFYGNESTKLAEHGLMCEANETYLFHGTRTEVVNLIEEHGIDERYGQLDGLFGAGNYFAENASKADQYCTADKESKLFPMLVMRVCLGSSVGSTGRDGEAEPVVPTLGGRMWQKIGFGNASKYFRSAEAVAKKLSKKDKRKILHSVIGHGIGAKDGLEFVVYQGIQCYPEFLLYYERVNDNGESIAADHLDDPEPAPTKQNDDDDPGIDFSEAESHSLRIKQLRQQLAEQKTRRVAAKLKQKQLKEELKKEQEEVFALESKSREPDSCMSCCRRQPEKTHRLTRAYVRSDVDGIDGDWGD